MTKMVTMPWATSAERNDFFNKQLDRFELHAVWGYVQSNNAPDSKGDPLLHLMHYHSTEHMKQVAALALWLLGKESVQDWQFNQAALPLAVACMFHDMNHSLGLRDDAANVADAKEAFLKYLIITLDSRIRDYAEIILDLIGITQFPYSKNRQPKNLIERCIRDADILYGMQDDNMDYVMFSLQREVNRKGSSGRLPFTLTVWAASRIDFLKYVEMYTPTANAIMDWALAEDNDHNHQSKIESWLQDDVIFRATHAHKLKANDVLFTDTTEDSVPKRHLISNIEDIGSHYNIYFDGAAAISLSNGESCVVCERRR